MLVRDDGAGSTSSSPSCSSIFLATIFGQNKHTHMAPYCLLLLPGCRLPLPPASLPLSRLLLLAFGCDFFALLWHNPIPSAHTGRNSRILCICCCSSPAAAAASSAASSLLPFSPFFGFVFASFYACACASAQLMCLLSALPLPLLPPSPCLPTRLLWPYIVFSIEHFTY